MNLKEKWGTRVWNNVSVEDLIKVKLDESDSGQIEELQDKVRTLSEILSNLMGALNLSDEQKLEIVGLCGWELVK